MALWVEDCFDWFDDRFPPPVDVVLPTRAFFAAPRGAGHDTARAVLDDVQRHLRFSEPISMTPLARHLPEHRHDYAVLSEISGSYAGSGNHHHITYDPDQLARPIAFINTLAHEVMHARLAPHVDEVPGGDAAHELATDLGCIIAGFGIFQLEAANAAGWSGYLSQNTRAFALAMFLERRKLDPERVLPYLSGRCAKLLGRAIRASQ